MRLVNEGGRRVGFRIAALAVVCVLFGLLNGQPRPAVAEDLEAACIAGNAVACNAKGDSMIGKIGWHYDWAKAAPYYAKACDGGNLQGCASYGRALVEARGIPEDKPLGIALVERACTGGIQAGCGYLGAFHVRAQGLPKNEAKGLALLDQACNAGHALSCTTYGITLKHHYGPPEERATAFAYFRKGCALGDISGCHEEGWAQWAGEGAPRNGAAALPPFKKACDWGLKESCAFAARIYEEGTGVPVDVAAAKPWREKQCKDDPTGPCSRIMGRVIPTGPVVVQAAAPMNPRCAELVVRAHSDVDSLEAYAARQMSRTRSDADSIAAAKQDLIVQLNTSCQAAFPRINQAAALNCPVEVRRALYSSAFTIGRLIETTGDQDCTINIRMHRDRYLPQ